MSARALRPSWVACSAVTALTGACVAAVLLSASPVAVAAPVEPPPFAPALVGVSAQAARLPAPLAPVARPAAPAVRVAAPTRTASVTTSVRRKPAVRRQAAVRRPAARTAQAPAASRCTGAGWQARRGAAAVSSLRRPADARAVPVAFRPADPRLLGLTDLHRRSVQVFVRPCARQSDALLRHVVAHELGHVVDVTVMDPASRAAWKAARGIPAGTPWFGCDGCTDFQTPAGDFAETYAQWQRGARTSRSQLAPPATPAELQRLAARFFRPLPQRSR